MSITPRPDISGIFCRPLLRIYVPLQIRASRGWSASLLAVDQCSAAWGHSGHTHTHTLDSLKVELWKNMKCSTDLIYELYLVPSTVTMLIDARCALELVFAVNDDNKGGTRLYLPNPHGPRIPLRFVCLFYEASIVCLESLISR